MDVINSNKNLTIQVDHELSFYPDSYIDTDNSTILRAQDLNTMSDVCVKIIKILGTNDREREISLERAMSETKTIGWLSTKTRHVPSLRYTYYDKSAANLYIVMDWMEGQTLNYYMAKDERRSPNNKFIKWMIELCTILELFEQRNGSHKDIKPSNIIIDKEDRLNLIDFNITSSLANKVEGTPGYRAPEMEPGMAVGSRKKVDMFAIGVMMYEYYTGKIPIKGKDYLMEKSGAASMNQFTQFLR